MRPQPKVWKICRPYKCTAAPALFTTLRLLLASLILIPDRPNFGSPLRRSIHSFTVMILFVILYNLLFLSLVECSNIGTFKDKTCSKSLDNYNGPNGYPDGTCTPLHLQSQQSFQVVGLDPGCQGETSRIRVCVVETDFGSHDIRQR